MLVLRKTYDADAWPHLSVDGTLVATVQCDGQCGDEEDDCVEIRRAATDEVLLRVPHSVEWMNATYVVTRGLHDDAFSVFAVETGEKIVEIECDELKCSETWWVVGRGNVLKFQKGPLGEPLMTLPSFWEQSVLSHDGRWFAEYHYDVGVMVVVDTATWEPRRVEVGGDDTLDSFASNGDLVVNDPAGVRHIEVETGKTRAKFEDAGGAEPMWMPGHGAARQGTRLFLRGQEVDAAGQIEERGQIASVSCDNRWVVLKIDGGSWGLFEFVG